MIALQRRQATCFSCVNLECQQSRLSKQATVASASTRAELSAHICLLI